MGRRLAITFIRHGMTALNRQRAYIGWTDAPLAAAERVRLSSLKPKLPMAVDRIVSSDLRRCRETAALLFGGRPADWWTSWWRELSFGDWEGKTFAELNEDPAYRQWLEAPFSVAPPGGESYAGFQKRIKQAFTKTLALAERSGARHIAIITHGGPIRFMLEQYAPTSRSFWEWDVPFAGGYTLDSTIGRWKGGERCISLSAVRFKENENGCGNDME
ncbi:phosphoglycerate mutase [Geobacillus thermodenitrificans]|uniref:Alpha-ribazole-5'-phosphate phosphatase n=3 Tax=Geobacillus thermodenitrificans TaxID=33940 RepID=A4IQD7_GEOTN|nr:MULTISPECIES: histidine phosphatase family protein [Geobacillus]ABO67541.1 Alpha-ribazole-5'-phosphate phosphatase [Geobacillus thermodenitrificans NG80-2]ARP43299.1 Alpha-ribazole phosphatase [Geobacillus thermodenitrificans]ATO38605.1 phosphoglycerate mutase [Geobacillus thermodenitrificans]KQB92755.1 phosphoglycerate mutase [Geobacillus sp. PA-3]PJW21862.1 histidine phosphatase family protein [Geobacillus thermodenitrificans]